jgi:hypothetical protein
MTVHWKIKLDCFVGHANQPFVSAHTQKIISVVFGRFMRKLVELGRYPQI